MKVYVIIYLAFISSIACFTIKDDTAASVDQNQSEPEQPSNVDDFVQKLTKSVSSASVNHPSSAVSAHTAKCECAVFNSQTPDEKDEAILIQGPINVSCNAAGEEVCLRLCSALAQAARDHGNELLCSTVGHYYKLKASVHSRVCGLKQWTYTGLTAPEEICCHERQVIKCEDMPKQFINNL